VVDTAGNIVNHLTIDSFGRRTAETNGNIEVMIGLSGRPYDEDTRLQNHVNRWYSVDTGRWLSEDPIGFAGGHANLYAYTGNSPVNGTDSHGLLPGGWTPDQIAAWKARRFLQVTEIFEAAGMDVPQDVLNSFGAIPTKPNIPMGIWDSVGQSISSLPATGAAIGAEVGGDDVYADVLWDDAYQMSPIGQLDDSPIQQAIVTGAIGVAGTALATATGVILINALTGSTMSVTMVSNTPGGWAIRNPHFGWKASRGEWYHATGWPGLFTAQPWSTATSMGAGGWFRTISGIPIRNASGTVFNGTTSNCFTGVCRAIIGGWR
jgi:RHS repeat-associated protein